MIPTTQIERVRNPSAEEFNERFLLPQRPVVIEGAIDDWKALAEWSAESFATRFGDQMLKVVRIDKTASGYFANNLSPDEIRLEEYLELFRSPGDGPPEIYAGGIAVGDFPGLVDELKYPVFLDSPDVMPYFWIGLRGAHTKMHYDLQDNIHPLITGRKRVFVADRDHLRDMYPVPLLRPQWYLHPTKPFALDRIKSRVDIENPDYQAFPRLRNVKVLEAELVPGEILYIPSCWWHELHNLESSIAINYWWRGVPTTPQYKRAMRHTEWARFMKRVKRRIPLVG